MLESLHQIGGVTGCFVLKLVLGPQLACPKKSDPKTRQEIEINTPVAGARVTNRAFFDLVGLAAFDKSIENNHL